MKLSIGFGLGLGLWFAHGVTAVKIPFTRRLSDFPPARRSSAVESVVRRDVLSAGHALVQRDSSDSELTLDDVHDMIYIANVSLGGQSYKVQLDTGSSDLWIKGPQSPLPNTQQTSQTYNLTYGIGWAYGQISYATVQFAGKTVQNQAYLDVSSAVNPALNYDADGILGLGFTSLSTIDSVVGNASDSKGQSLLASLFKQNPSEPNYVAFSLQRSTGQNKTIKGAFSVGQVEDENKAVLDQTAIPTFPPSNPNRWSVLLDAVLTNGSTISVSSNVTGAPSGTTVAVIDSGTSWTYAPEDVCTAIYGGINGAHFSDDEGVWIVPCDAEVDIALQFSGEVYPLHPLDVVTPSSGDPNVCGGTFVPQAVSVADGAFDMLIGDNVLRSIYTVFDFGDFDSKGNMGNPYIKMLALIDPDTASADFVGVRGGTAKSGIVYNAAGGGSSGSTTVSLSTDVAEAINNLGKFFPAMLAIMALNALVLVILVILGIAFLCKRRKTKKRSRNVAAAARENSPTPRFPPGRMSTMPLSRMEPRSMMSGISGPLQQVATEPHAYQPVSSMAFTEDTPFAPPQPAFRSSEDSRFVGQKPEFRNSYADGFTPPSPAFHQFDDAGGRPRSMA